MYRPPFPTLLHHFLPEDSHNFPVMLVQTLPQPLGPRVIYHVSSTCSLALVCSHDQASNILPNLQIVCVLQKKHTSFLSQVCCVVCDEPVISIIQLLRILLDDGHSRLALLSTLSLCLPLQFCQPSDKSSDGGRRLSSDHSSCIQHSPVHARRSCVNEL